MNRPQGQAAAAASATLAAQLRQIIGHRGVQAAALLWLCGYALVLWLARGALPRAAPRRSGARCLYGAVPARQPARLRRAPEPLLRLGRSWAWLKAAHGSSLHW
jgi:hypothetical protein